VSITITNESQIQLNFAFMGRMRTLMVGTFSQFVEQNKHNKIFTRSNCVDLFHKNYLLISKYIPKLN
jgi:hypothetical protein